MRLLLIVVLALSSPLLAANKYVKPGGTGNGATDWSTAAGCLESLTIARGDLIYIAGGSYASCIVNFAFSTAASGTTTIELRKATDADHGSSTGWTNGGTMGNSQSVINPLYSHANYIIINGVSRTSPIAGHGIKILNNNGAGGQLQGIGLTVGWPGNNQASNNNIVEYVEVQGTGYNAGDCNVVDTGILFSPGSGSAAQTGSQVLYSYSHDTGGDNLDLYNQSGMVVDHSYFARNHSAGTCHGDGVAADSATGFIFRYNILSDHAGTCQICDTNASGTQDWQIYGNVFTAPSAPQRGGITNGAIAFVDGGQHFTSVKIYNNTFVNVHSQLNSCNIGWQIPTDTAIVENNLWDDCPHTQTGSKPGVVTTWTWDYNASFSSGTTDVSTHAQNVAGGEAVANWTSGNYHLTTDTAAWTPLSSPYNIDIDGVVRSTSRSAYQATGGASTFSITGTVTPAAGSSATAGTGVLLACTGGCTPTSFTTLAGGAYTFSGIANGAVYSVTPSEATYTFSPACSGTISSNVTCNFTATGTATASLTPSTWNFGSEGIGLMSAAKLFSYTATGTADLTSVAVSITGTNAGDFIRTDSSCPATITAGTHCNPTVVFSPTAGGARSATLQVSSSNFATQTALLTGTAFQPPTPSCSPAGGSYKSARIVNCSNAILAATMCWSTTSPPTTNGNGTCTSGTTYIAPFMISSTSTLFVTGTQAGNADQAVSYSFTINPAWTTGWVMNSSTVGATTFGTSGAIQALVQLPQNWVNNLEYVGTTTNTINFPATSTGGSWTCAANSTTYGPYTADTTSSLQTAINNAETCRTAGGTGTVVNIPAGHSFSNTTGLSLPQTAGDTSTNFIILQSTTPLTAGRTACSHGIQDNLSTSTQPGIRNVGCDATKMSYQLGTTITPINYALDTLTSTGNQAFSLANGTATNTSAYNDKASMWTAQCTQANCNVISTPTQDVNGISSHHFAILNAELRPAAALVAVAAPVKIGQQTETAISQLPSHIHLAYDYIHGDWTDAPVSGGVGTGSPTGANSIPNGVNFAACNSCSLAYSYIDKMLRPGSEGHAVVMEYVQQLKVVHNWIEGQSIGLLSGGLNDTIDIPNFVPATDVEDRGNRYTYPYSWILAADAGFCPNGLACGPNGYVRKNSHELKVAERYVYDGNINEHVDNSGAQNGINLSWKVSNAGGGAQGNYWFVNENVTFTNNVMRDSCRGGSWGYRSNFGISTGGGVTLPTQKANWTNNLTYNISLVNPGCSSASPIAGLQVNTNNGGTSWDASCTRDSAGLTSSCVLTSKAGGTQSDMNVGDPVNVISCTDTTLNTPTTGLTLALPGTLFSGLTVVYPNVGTPNASSGGCQLGYFQGWPRYFTYDHNTEVINSGADSPFSVGGSTPIELARDLTFSNSVYVHGGPNSTFGEGTRTLTKGFDGTSLKFHHLAFTERDSAVSCPGHNPNPGGIAACYAEWDTKGTQVSPTTIWGTQTASCAGGANSTCLGIVGGLNMGSLPTVLSDYHGYALASGSIFKAGQANQASDGTDLGVNISAIDAAQVSNQYTGGFPDH